jgi:Transposase DDE domain
MKIFPPEYETFNRGHGRIEFRKIRTSTKVNDRIIFPFVGQVAKINRTVYDLAGQLLREEEVYCVTSLTPDKADAQRLLTLNRGHWTIENRLHYVRDVTFDEDRSQIRTKQGPRVMATLRNLAISLLRLSGVNNIAKATRENYRHPELTLEYIAP